MNNSFDRLIGGLASEYGMPSFPAKKHEHEIYCFAFEVGVSINIYQDEFRWVYFVAEMGQFVETNVDTLGRMLHFNSFSFKKQFFTLGLSGGDVDELHARVPLVEVDSVEMRKIFENLLNAGNLRTSLKYAKIA